MRRFLATLLLLVPLCLSLTACPLQEGDQIRLELPTAPGDSPASITIRVAGSCEVELASINCRDSSTSDPAGQLDTVLWSLYRGTATLVAIVEGQPGATVSFGPSLDLVTYRVEQVVFADDGTSNNAVYNNLSVSGG